MGPQGGSAAQGFFLHLMLPGARNPLLLLHDLRRRWPMLRVQLRWQQLHVALCRAQRGRTWCLACG